MPSYDFACDCGNSFEVFLSYSEYDEFIPSCPCGKTAHRDYSGGLASACRVAGVCNTLGQQAEQNKKRLGKEQHQALFTEEAHRFGKMKEKDEDIPWWRSGIGGSKKLDAPVDLNKIPDVNRYIETGK